MVLKKRLRVISPELEAVGRGVDHQLAVIVNAIGKKAYPVELLFRDGPDFILQVVEFTVVVVGVSLVGSGIVQAYAQLGDTRQDVTELALGGILGLEERDPILNVFRDGEGSGDGGFQLGGNGQPTGVSSFSTFTPEERRLQALGQPGAELSRNPTVWRASLKECMFIPCSI